MKPFLDLSKVTSVFGNPREGGNWHFKSKEMMDSTGFKRKIATKFATYVANNVYAAVVRINKDDRQ